MMKYLVVNTLIVQHFFGLAFIEQGRSGSFKGSFKGQMYDLEKDHY